MMVSQRNLLFQESILKFHVNIRGVEPFSCVGQLPHLTHLFLSAGRLCTTKEKTAVNCDCVSGSPNGNALKIGPQHVSQRDHGTVTLQTRFRRL